MISLSPAAYAHVFDVNGDITAADVDLLPMPSLVSYPSKFGESLSLSPTDSAMTRISSSDSISSGNSCKSGGRALNFLGLPPNFRQEIDTRDDKNFKCDEFIRAALVGSPRKSSGGHVEQNTFRQLGSRSLGQGAHDFQDIISSCVHNPIRLEEDDNFADSLAVFWSQHPMNCDTEMLHDAGTLASILTDVPQKLREASSGTSANLGSDVDNCIPTDFMMDEFDFLVIPSKEASEKSSVELPCVFQPIVSASMESLNASVGRESFQDGTFSEKSRCDVLKLNDAIEDWSSLQLEAAPKMQATSSETSLNGSSVEFQTREISSWPSLPIQAVENCTNDGSANVLGRKRPFSVLELPNIASAPTVPSCASISRPNSWLAQPEFGNVMQQHPDVSYASATQAFSAMLYKSRGAQSLHLTAENDESKPPPSKIRRRHGTAMDPQSIAARTRREKFSDRIRVLQGLVPNAERLDTVSMLGQTLEYVRFLQHQVWQLYHGMDPASPNNLKSEKWKDFLEPKRASA